ncbi:MAG: Mrp/NBP35 family ATP-binding protein [Clostridia bacterium]|nr:Mrp/NBP35 family ATP-binding protein [Clostridia bacterium]
MSECTHDCSTCQAACGSRENGKESESMLVNPGKGSNIKKVYAVVSGKGGVGKSLVTSLLAVNARRADKSVAILDADITGPSIPRVFGIKGGVTGDGTLMCPAESRTGIKIMSLNLLLERETDPVAWRGPIIAGAVQQFWTDVNWGDVDEMYIDMPPGTGDVPLTVFQSIPVNGIIIVTSPQELVSMIVEKAVKLAEMVNIPVVGIVENFSYFKCPDCGKEHRIFGESGIERVAEQYGIPKVEKLPIDPKLASACDKGCIELYGGGLLTGLE